MIKFDSSHIVFIIIPLDSSSITVTMKIGVVLNFKYSPERNRSVRTRNWFGDAIAFALTSARAISNLPQVAAAAAAAARISQAAAENSENRESCARKV